MAITTSESLLGLLEKSQLLTPEQLAQAREAAAQTEEARPFAKVLVQQKLLTRWQAGALLSGHIDSFAHPRFYGGGAT